MNLNEDTSMLRALLLSLFCLLTLHSQASFDDIKFNHLTQDPELFQATINSIYQDETGKLWFGVRTGVKIFDGNRFESFELPGDQTTLHSPYHHPSICGDGKGHLYFNTSSGIFEYDQHRECFRPVFDTAQAVRNPSPLFTYGSNRLWLAKQDSIYAYRNGELSLFTTLQDTTLLITTLYESHMGFLWAGTQNHGLYLLDTIQGKKNFVFASESEITSLFEDSRRNIWIGTLNNGLFRIAPSGAKEHYTTETPQPLLSNYIRKICEDDQGRIWIGTMQGINIISPETSTIRAYQQATSKKNGLSNPSVWTIVKDTHGTMWIGTYYGGINYCNPGQNPFNHIPLESEEGSPYSIVGEIAEDKQGILWIGTEGNGLLRYDPSTDETRYFTKDNGSGLHSNNIIAMVYDPEEERLWLGTHLGGLQSYDIREGVLSDHLSREETAQRIHGLDLRDDTLYVASLSGLYALHKKNGGFHYLDLSEHYYEIKDILLDSRGRLWIAGSKLTCMNLADWKIRFFESELPSRSHNSVITTSLLETREGKIAVTSADGLWIFDPDTEHFTHLSSQNSPITNNYLTCLGELRDGGIIAGSNTGIVCFRKDLSGECHTFDHLSNFPLVSMLPGCIYRTREDKILLGGFNGIAQFNEEVLYTSPETCNIWFSNLWVNNRRIFPNDESGILKQPLAQTGKLTLAHDCNDLKIEIGNDNYENIDLLKFQYSFSQAKDEWIDFTPREAIQRYSMPFGNYTLKVRVTSPLDPGTAEEIQLKIRIRPPFYLTWYAYLCYILFILGGIYIYRSRLLLKTKLEYEHREKLQQEEITDSKQRFFANMSHELKTPITLIAGQLELLMLSSKLPEETFKSIAGIHAAANKMNQQISDFLDFIKMDRGKFRLKVSQQDIVSFVREIYHSFEPIARLNGFHFTFDCTLEQCNIWFDPVQMQKIFYNLLSNAFKYTPQQGEISLSIEEGRNEDIILSVSDNGIGIPDEMKENIFERFYQVKNAQNRSWSNTGSGIGLSLVREILTAHHGTIRVEDAPGGGTLFKITLSTRDDLFDQDPNAEQLSAGNIHGGVKPFDPKEKELLQELYQQQRALYPELPKLLIVEDDSTLRGMLVNIFSPIFQILEAEDGAQGLEVAQKESPDLILSDVLMPKMTGSELCNRIKNQFDTCHIPIILLTALGGTEHQIQGLTAGADDYIAKPFNIRLLVIRCVNLLNTRRILQEKFLRQEEPLPQTVTTNPLDQAFIEEAIRIVEENLEQGHIDVGILSSKLAISRTKLFLKMKGITGQTPLEFIQSIKLKMAARMLREELTKNISEITFYLGFSSLNYFGKYFKNYFGVSPSAYRKAHQQSASSDPATPTADENEQK